MTVLDASAMLAYLAGEPGADIVEAAFPGSRCSAANWSETAQKVRAKSGDWLLARALLLSQGLIVEPVLAADAEWAAKRWERGEGLSLGDRLCLALGARLAEEVLTADRTWGERDGVRQIR